jgi:hypothetical protein
VVDHDEMMRMMKKNRTKKGKNELASLIRSQ